MIPGSPPDLLAVDHDLDGIPPGSTPARSIVVCSAPGATSTLVADLLRRCGAGVPLEYFDLDTFAAPLSRRWRVINLDDYITALHHHRSADNGVFGLVLRWQQLRRLHRQVIGLKQLTAERMLTIATTIAPNPTFLLVRSTEPEHAAVALQEDSRAVAELRAIAERRALQEATEQAWLQWFAMSGVRPLQIAVEPGGEFAAPEERLMEALQLAAPGGSNAMAVGASSGVKAGRFRLFRSDRGTGRTADF